MKVLSLFDGMSCGQIALNRLGIKYDEYYASEIDEAAISITLKNYPKTKQIGSVIDVDPKNLPTIDLLIGGSPCQSFSFSGKRNGMTTTENLEILDLQSYLFLKDSGFTFEGQSYLFWEYVRILKEKNPTYFLLENVNMAKKWEDLISSVLGVTSIRINSNLVGAANRNRLYWTNIPVTGEIKDKNLTFKDIKDDNSENYSYWTPEQMQKFHEKKYVRNDYYRIEHDENKVQCLLAQSGQSHPKTWSDKKDTFRRLTPLEFERCQTVPENYTLGVSNKQRFKMLGNGWTVDVICHILKNIDILI